MNPVRHEVVAALLVRDGRVLLCHRHPDRLDYPNVWDVPGGHVEADETPTAALQRELGEELGIAVRLDSFEPFRTMEPSPELRLRIWAITEWDGEIENRARDEHDDIAWFTTDEVRHLDLADQHLVDVLVNAIDHNERAGPQSATTDGVTRRHLTIVIAETDVPEVARLRRRWDPVMASGVPPHITVVYPEEAGDFDVLIDRARHLVPQIPAFPMRLRSAIAIEDGAGGVFIEAHDESGSLDSLRDALLAPPFESGEFTAHVTLVHPRTSRSGHLLAARRGLVI